MSKGTVSITAGIILISAALSLTGYNVYDERRAGRESEKALESISPKIEKDPVPAEGRMHYLTEVADPMYEDEPEYPDYVLNPNMDMPVVNSDGTDYIGVISIPSLEREVPVISEWNYKNLRISPCRYCGSAYLDDMVICAHNYGRHFGQLRNLNYGDRVIFTDIAGNVFNYEVVEIEMLSPDAVDDMKAGDWDLTLFTCTVGGSERVTVRCERLKS